MSPAKSSTPEPRKPKSGKGFALQARITEDTRRALEAEATRTGRSLSQVAEVWLDDARRGREDLQSLLGGLGVAESIIALVRFARKAEEQFGSPAEDILAREALIAGWRRMVGRMLPFTPDSPEGTKVRVLRSALKSACHLALIAMADPAVPASLIEKLSEPIVRRPNLFGRTDQVGAEALSAADLMNIGGGDMSDPHMDALGARLASIVDEEEALRDELKDVLRYLKAYQQARSENLSARGAAAARGVELAKGFEWVEPLPDPQS